MIFNIQYTNGYTDDSEISFDDIIQSQIDGMDSESSARQIRKMYLTDDDNNFKGALTTQDVDVYQNRLDNAASEAGRVEAPYRASYDGN